MKKLYTCIFAFLVLVGCRRNSEESIENKESEMVEVNIIYSKQDPTW